MSDYNLPQETQTTEDIIDQVKEARRKVLEGVYRRRAIIHKRYEEKTKRKHENSFETA